MKILVTGANRGLGLELTKLFLKEGHEVAAGMRANSNSDALDSLKKEYSNRLKIIQLDMKDESTMAHSADLIKSQWGSLDIIINNAGILLGRNRKFNELDLEELITSFKVNTFGPMMLIKHLAGLMEGGESPMIINITSEAANDLSGRDYPYSLSKAALNMYSIKLNNHLKEAGIRVLAVHPGWIRTDMGGQNAPGAPETTARNILDIIEGRIKIDDDLVFISHTGIGL